MASPLQEPEVELALKFCTLAFLPASPSSQPCFLPSKRGVPVIAYKEETGLEKQSVLCVSLLLSSGWRVAACEDREPSSPATSGVLPPTSACSLSTKW